MAHHLYKTAYPRLVERLNRFPKGVVPSALLYKILKMLFSEKEAELVSVLPIKPFTVQKAAHIWKLPLIQAQKILNQLAQKALLVDLMNGDQQIYVLPPPMAGFFEFSMMRVQDNLNQQLLAELYYEYMNVEEDFVKSLFTHGETRLGRVFVNEEVLSNENALVVLDYERASHVICSASEIGISICYCRHKMMHNNRACNNPMEICMTFNTSAHTLIKHGFARRVDPSQCLELLHKAYSHNLVQFGDNVRERVNFICNCCGCCCEALIAARKFGMYHPVHTTNFLPKINEKTCTGCGKCVQACPVEAMALISANHPHHLKKTIAQIRTEICLGCGVCARVCSSDSISMISRAKRVITPLNSTHQAVLMAIERNKLQNLIFDNQLFMHHRALAAIFGVILKLPIVKRVLALKQIRSRYLEALIKWYQQKKKLAL